MHFCSSRQLSYLYIIIIANIYGKMNFVQNTRVVYYLRYILHTLISFSPTEMEHLKHFSVGKLQSEV